MNEPICRICGCPVNSADMVQERRFAEYSAEPIVSPAQPDLHRDPAICQALLLRKLVEHVTAFPMLWSIPAAGTEGFNFPDTTGRKP